MSGTVISETVTKYLLSLVLVFFTSTASALNWDVSAQHAGFMVELSLGVGLENEAHWFGMDLSVGGARDTDGSVVSQYNLKMRFMPWTWDTSRYGKWDFPYFGIQAMYSRAGDFFYKSPGQYPEGDYYDETSLRTGIFLGLAWNKGPWSVFYEVVLIDTDVIAQYNTRSALEYEQLLSSAVGIRYYFDLAPSHVTSAN